MGTDSQHTQVGDSGASLRHLPSNPNHWYAVRPAADLKGEPQAIELWDQALVIYRDQAGVAHALEDVCPHRLVKLSHGRVEGGHLVCTYHGWQFDAQGACVAIPYLQPEQRIPACRVRSYPVREQDGFIWVFPGDPALADQVTPLPIPEWHGLKYLGSWALIDTATHFSYLIENLMDMHHGYLHSHYQPWGEARLETVNRDTNQVIARYQAQCFFTVDQIWSMAQLFLPALRQPHPETLTVRYAYPHWIASLGEDFKLYCLLVPAGRHRTRAYFLHFTSLHRFPKLHTLPVWFRRWIKGLFSGTARNLLEGLVREDMVMIEEEQRMHDTQPQRRGREVNPTLTHVQNLIRTQAGR
ncbi:MAG: aromatic ring-hydroxylating dioxygenase subunit alpha [Gloeomargaritaceae cyanobacterium C42_A2020_066]|nr:aromatic ring-hydroxylating dioxygenase subunit alpha [Gloeomargaritaceae cyanobacterium C42_A2020_066]